MRILTLCTLIMMFLTVGVEPVVREAVRQPAIALDAVAKPGSPLRLDAPARGLGSDGLRWDTGVAVEAWDASPARSFARRSDRAILIALTSSEHAPDGAATEAPLPMREAA